MDISFKMKRVGSKNSLFSELHKEKICEENMKNL